MTHPAAVALESTVISHGLPYPQNLELARDMGLEHVYLGYWIQQCQKMSYKSDYRPLQIYQNSRWTTLI